MKLLKITLIVLLVILTASFLFGSLISIESEGFSIIGSDLNKTRDIAINNAIQNGIKKFLKNKNLKVQDSIVTKIKNSAVSGFEIINESFEGNILKEKIKLLLDEEEVNALITPSSEVPIIIYLKTFLNSKYDENLKNFLKSFLMSKFNYNFAFTDNEEDYNFSIELKINLIKIKELKSIGKNFYNLNGEIIISDLTKKIIDNKTFSRDLTLKKEDEYLKYVNKLIENPLREAFSVIMTKYKITPKKSSNKEIIFTLIKPKTYNEIQKLINIFNDFNLNFSLIEIYNGDVVFQIKDISEDGLINILRAKNFVGEFKISFKQEVSHEGLH